MRRMNILLVGGSGLLGSELFRSLKMAGHSVDAPSSAELDLTDQKSIDAALSKKYEAVINAAAMIDVDQAEELPDLAYRVNAEGAAMLASSSARYVLFSTNYVFGDEKGAYSEDDTPRPINVYGASKAKGEDLVREACAKNGALCTIIRTSWLYGHARPTFIDGVMEKLQCGERVRALSQRGNFTYARDLAERIVKDFIASNSSGIFHLTNASVPLGVARLEAAQEVARIIGAQLSLVEPEESEAVFRAKRPEHAVLQSTRVPPLPEWKDALRRYIRSQYQLG